MEDLLYKRWGSLTVTGDEEPTKPSLLAFRNSLEAIKILNKHITNNNKIVVHSDVDLDGVGCGYVARRTIASLGNTNTLFIINDDKIHGIQEKHLDFFNNKYKIDLLIIVDSSSNEIDIIKEFNCDVIVIDHHEILHTDTYGKTSKGYEYVIINNMLDNNEVGEINELLSKSIWGTTERVEEYKADSRMSGCMALYELLRLYCEVYIGQPVLENLLLYQWVGCTLFSDSIILATERNQWYVQNTVHSQYLESCLQVITQNINDYKAKLDKTFILYNLAPTINRAIRAGYSKEVLDTIVNEPSKIVDLIGCKEEQDRAIEICCSKTEVYPNEFILKDISDKGINKNYCGVVASRLCGDNVKNTCVYIVKDGIAQGSFRGRRYSVDYRKYFEDYAEGIFAQGHKAAFGFRVPIEKLEDLMRSLSSLEPEKEELYLTAGNLPSDLIGTYHIANKEEMDKFKKDFYLIRLALANSNVSSLEQLSIVGSTTDVKFIEQTGKIYKYDYMGIVCKSFEPIQGKYIQLYVEYTTQLDAYIKNYKI